MVVMRASLKAVLVSVVFLLLLWVTFIVGRRSASSSPGAQSISQSGTAVAPKSASPVSSSDLAPTNVYAHNLMLRKGPSFRVYVRWLRGQMARSRKPVNPSFDDPDSFSLYIKTGVIRANIGDIANYLNSGALGDTP